MNSTRLFIENVEVELDNSVQFAITRQFEDITNPTTIINDWSKTVAIPFTKSNNKLFGHIYNPDKVVIGQVINEIDNFDYGVSFSSTGVWDEHTHSYYYTLNQPYFNLTGLTVKTQKYENGMTTVVDILDNNIYIEGHYEYTLVADGSWNRICFQLNSSPFSPTLFFDVKNLTGTYTFGFDVTEINPITKTISFANVFCTVPGTQYNDTVFATGIHFDPYKKLDFRLEWNGDLIMSGYAKMNDIKQVNGKGTYNVTLNGQLGKLFQEMKKITFKPADAISDDYLIDGAHYVDVIMSKELIKDSWESTGQSVESIDDAGLHDIIGFAPNNSFNEDFDYTSYQVDETSSRKFTATLGTTFQRDSGFDPETAIPDGLLPREIGEYRSYLQLPFIYFNKLFQIFQKRAEAITGYKFDLDPDWFSTSNPYWYDLVFMLKRPYDDDNITYTNVAKSTDPTPHTYLPHTEATTDRYKYGYDFAPRNPIDNWSITLDQGIEYNSSSNTFTTYEGDKKESFTIDVGGTFTATLNRNLQSNTYVRVAEDCGIVIHYAIMIDESNIVDLGGFCLVDEESTAPIPEGFKKVVVRRQEIKNIGDSVTVSLPQTQFTITNPNISAPFRVISYMSGVGAEGYDHASLFAYRTSSKTWDAVTIGDFGVDNYVASFSETQPLVYKSGSRLILNDLWNHDYNLFGEILKYCKMYRIGITVNDHTKLIKFTPLSTYFSGHTIEDWTDKLDLTKDYIVTPITWDTKFVLFNYEDTETKLGEDYKSKYGVNYGEYRLITDYNFNTDTNPLFDGIKTSMVNVENVLSWTNLYDNHRISYSVADEPFITCKDKDKKYVDCFGQYYFHLGTHEFSTETALNMRDVCVSDDTELQQTNNTFFYSQNTNQVRVTSYPWLDTNRLRLPIALRPVRTHCLFNVPKESYTITSFHNNSLIKYTDKSIYSLYWEKYINERYNIQNKKVTCYLRIKPQDYKSFDFNKFVMIGDQLYFVNKIYDYDITSTESTKVDLITIQDINGYTNE